LLQFMLQFTGAESEMRNWNPPVIATQCVDCGLGTYAADEYPHTIKTEVWEQVWVGRRKSWRAPGTEILCIGCLEDRLGRRLTRADFTDAPCNDPHRGHAMSARLRARLTQVPNETSSVSPSKD
jgi:hypothetical protein